MNLRRVLVLTLVMAPLMASADWPQFRGPTGQGLVPGDPALPLNWSPTQNVAWKTPIPGHGWSSPVISNGVIYLTTAIAAGETQAAPATADRSLHALAIKASTGEILWNTKVFDQPGSPSIQVHGKNSHASPTPVVAFNHIFVHFGPLGTACLDLKGKIVWTNRDLKFDPVHGNGGSPVVIGDKLIFSCDGPPDPYVAALKVKNGALAWKTPRNTTAKSKFSFCTPLEVGKEVVIPGSGNLVSYDPGNGRELWRCNWGDGYSVVPRPVFGHGIVYASSGYNSAVLYAVRPGGQGDVTTSQVAWKFDGKCVPKNSSFILVGNELFTFDDKGIGTCFDAKTGEVIWQERVCGDISSSPIASKGRIYLSDEKGQCVVLEAARELKILATNPMNERIFASFAVEGNDLIIRSETTLYRIKP